MAIDADIILCDKAGVITMPPVKRYPVAAAGFVDFAVDASIVAFRNFSTSQAVNIRLNLDADATAAGPADDKSVRVEIGETFIFDVTMTDLTAARLSVT